VVPFLAVAGFGALWMTASTITAVGVIGFLGLLAPNLARMMGARTALDELISSLLLGALVLLLTDTLAIHASSWSRDLVPSGASAALIGAPALIWLSIGRLKARDHIAFALARAGAPLTMRRSLVIGGTSLLLVAAAILVAPTPEGWATGWPNDLALSLRWPRVLAAAAAGAGMAVAGLVLQRLLRNPLASPDIIGISSGATVAMVGTVLVTGGSIHEAGASVALLGGLAVLGLLLLLGRRHGNVSSLIALTGISLAALLDAVLQFLIAKGGEETYEIIGWLAGSTYRVSEAQAIGLCIGVMALVSACLILNRWLTLLGLGDDIAEGRGLSVEAAKTVLLAMAAALAASVTAVVGPVAFVGLIAPQLSALLGARGPRGQAALACAIGVSLFVLSDWLGRVLMYPLQLPSGAMASILGGAYFTALLSRRRFH
jgi:iron complex transport system permease protein